jgi:hypothetical protein
VLLYIPIHAIAGEYEASHRDILISITLILSSMAMVYIAAIQDKKTGIDIKSKSAWTTDILESQHICFYIPLRLAGLILFCAGICVPFIRQT